MAQQFFAQHAVSPYAPPPSAVQPPVAAVAQRDSQTVPAPVVYTSGSSPAAPPAGGVYYGPYAYPFAYPPGFSAPYPAVSPPVPGVPAYFPGGFSATGPVGFYSAAPAAQSPEPSKGLMLLFKVLPVLKPQSEQMYRAYISTTLMANTAQEALELLVRAGFILDPQGFLQLRLREGIATGTEKSARCEQGLNCQDLTPLHRDRFQHPCRYGLECRMYTRGDVEHCRRYSHDPPTQQ